MQDNVDMNSPNGNNLNPNVESFHASEFMELSSEKQMVFVASRLVGIGNDVSILKSDVSKLKKGQTKLKAELKSTKSQVSSLSAKFDGFDYKLEGQNAKIEGQNERISSAKSQIKLWLIGAIITGFFVVSRAWEWIPEVIAQITESQRDDAE